MKNPFETFRVWEHKYALTFVGCVLAVIFGIPALYPLFEKKNPGLKMEIASSANVMDVKDDFKVLSITLYDTDIREKHLALTLVTLRISNDGAAPITKGVYDDNAPLGVKAIGGDILKAEIIGASTDYLTNNAAIIASPTSLLRVTNFVVGGVDTNKRPYIKYLHDKEINISVQFSNTVPSIAVLRPVIFEPGESVSVKLLILHPEKTPFELSPTGKIAGVRKITFVGLNEKSATPSFWNRVFGGTIGVQVFRICTYFGASIAVSILLSLFLSAFARAKAAAVLTNAKNNRKQKIVEFKTQQLETHTEATEFEWLLYYYIEDGERPLQVLNAALNHLPNMRKSVFIGTLPTGLFGILFERKIITIDLGNGQFAIKKEFFDFLKAFGKFVNPQFEEQSNLITIKKREKDKSEALVNLESQMKEGFGKGDKAVN